MPRNIHILLYAGLLACALTLAHSCIYPFEMALENHQVIVVEGDLVIGDYSSFTVSPPSNGTIWIENKNGLRAAETHGMMSGLMVDTRNLTGNGPYKVHFEAADGRKLETSWLEVSQPPVIDELYFNVVDPFHAVDSPETSGSGLQIMLSMHGAEGGSRYYHARFSETWQYQAYTNSHYYYDHIADELVTGWVNPNFICWNSRDNWVTTFTTEASTDNRTVGMPIMFIPAQDMRLQNVYRLVVKVSTMSQPGYDYWQNLDQVSYPTGDLFTPTPSSMRGNVRDSDDPSSMVLGYVDAGISVSDTVYYYNNLEHVYKDSPYIQRYITNSRYNQTEMDTNKSLDASGYWPYFPFYADDQPLTGEQQEPTYWVWIRKDCLDCRTFGGTTEMPSDWKETPPINEQL